MINDKPKRKYNMTGKYSKKGVLPKKQVPEHTENVQTDSQHKTEVKTCGLFVEFSPTYFEQLQKEEVRRLELEFRSAVLNPFSIFINELKGAAANRSDAGFELSAEVGQKSVEYANELGKQEILTPNSEFRLRCHIGLKLIMDWSTRHIFNLERELARLKRLAQNKSESELPTIPNLNSIFEQSNLDQTVTE